MPTYNQPPGGIDQDSPDELLDWLCWVWAVEGQSAYPPEEQVAEHVAAHENESLPGTTVVDEFLRGELTGRISLMWTQAVMRYEMLENRGFDPKACAERHVERRRTEGHGPSGIDWAWYDEHTRRDKGGE